MGVINEETYNKTNYSADGKSKKSSNSRVSLNNPAQILDNETANVMETSLDKYLKMQNKQH
jgi:hypothetical protein